MSEAIQGDFGKGEASINNPYEELGDLSAEDTAEKLDHKPVTTIDVRRHSDYDGRFPKAGWGKATEEEKERLGHLTEEGVANARRIAHETIIRRLEEANDNVDFLVVASPTSWLGDDALGQRAIETGKVYSDEIKSELEARGLPADRLLNTIHSPAAQHEIGDVRVSKKMVEAQMFDDPIALEQVVDGLRAKYGGQGTEFWNAWYNGLDDEALDSVGAEKSTGAAERADKQIEVLIRYGAMHNRLTGRSLEVILLTHHEVLQPYAFHKLGVEPESFIPGKNEGFEIKVEDGKAVVSVAGQKIERTSRADRRRAALSEESQ